MINYIVKGCVSHYITTIVAWDYISAIRPKSIYVLRAVYMDGRDLILDNQGNGHDRRLIKSTIMIEMIAKNRLNLRTFYIDV